MMTIEILGVKRSAGKTDSGSAYSGWKCFFAYPALDPQVNGREIAEKFFSDNVLNGIVPQPGDKFEIIYSLEGRLTSVKPVIEPKGNNYGQSATK